MHSYQLIGQTKRCLESVKVSKLSQQLLEPLLVWKDREYTYLEMQSVSRNPITPTPTTHTPHPKKGLWVKVETRRNFQKAVLTPNG